LTQSDAVISITKNWNDADSAASSSTTEKSQGGLGQLSERVSVKILLPEPAIPAVERAIYKLIEVKPMRPRRFFATISIYLGALLVTAVILYLAKTRWDHHLLLEALDPYVKRPVSFKLSRPDNQHQYYIEDFVQIQVTEPVTEVILVRHTPHDDKVRLPIEKAELQPNKTVMLLTHKNGNLYRIYLQPASFMLSVVNSPKNVVAMETGVKISADQVKLFQQDPLYQNIQ
jgi:hypothetical protein